MQDLGIFFYDKIHIMKKNGVDGLPIFPKSNEQCEACILDKKHRSSFPSSTWRAQRKL